MSLDADLANALSHFKKSEAVVFPATVKTVDEAKKTISCVAVDGFEFTDIRLAAAEDDKKSILVIPKVNSTVLLGIIGNQLNSLFVAKINEADTIVGTIESTEFRINASGYKVNRDGENLKAVLNDYIDEVNKIKVIYGNSINVLACNAIKARLNKILI